MKFILNRNHVHASTFGHAIDFQKGVPTYVPPLLRPEVLAIGAVPENDEEVIKEERVNVAPTDPEVRKAEIFEAFKIMIDAGKREYFTATGMPELNAVSEVVGFKVDQTERTRLWGEFQQVKDTAEGE